MQRTPRAAACEGTRFASRPPENYVNTCTWCILSKQASLLSRFPPLSPWRERKRESQAGLFEFRSSADWFFWLGPQSGSQPRRDGSIRATAPLSHPSTGALAPAGSYEYTNMSPAHAHGWATHSNASVSHTYTHTTAERRPSA